MDGRGTYIVYGFSSEASGTYPPYLTTDWNGGVAVISTNTGFGQGQLCFITNNYNGEFHLYARNIASITGVGAWKQIL